jgi:hypothetical protein
MKIKFSLQILEKFTNCKLHENPSDGSQVVPNGRTAGQTDRHDEANDHFSQFANVPQNGNIARHIAMRNITTEFKMLQAIFLL